jgi:PDZ domain-containing secreted protein
VGPGEIIPGDIITALRGKPVADFDELLETLERRQPGESVTLSLLRGGASGPSYPCGWVRRSKRTQRSHG